MTETAEVSLFAKRAAQRLSEIAADILECLDEGFAEGAVQLAREAESTARNIRERLEGNGPS